VGRLRVRPFTQSVTFPDRPSEETPHGASLQWQGKGQHLSGPRDAIASGTRLLNALAGITNASSTKRYVIKVEPGRGTRKRPFHGLFL
jgi:hypothetical protein